MSDHEKDLRAELERLRAENESLKARGQKALRLQVSDKGGVSLYGLRRFPITFYQDEWQTLLDMGEDIREFIRENESRLKRKSAG